MPSGAGFAVAREIWHIDGKCAEGPCDGRHRGQPCVGKLRPTGSSLCVAAEKWATGSIGGAKGPDEHGDKADWDYYGLSDEEVA